MLIHLIENINTNSKPRYDASILRFTTDNERPFNYRHTELKDGSLQIDQWILIDNVEKLEHVVDRNWFANFEDYSNFLHDGLVVLKE